MLNRSCVVGTIFVWMFVFGPAIPPAQAEVATSIILKLYEKSFPKFACQQQGKYRSCLPHVTESECLRFVAISLTSCMPEMEERYPVKVDRVWSRKIGDALDVCVGKKFAAHFAGADQDAAKCVLKNAKQ